MRGAFFLAISAGQAALANVASVRARYDDYAVRFEITYDTPSPFSAGWEFQLFIDADDDATTGYWSGFDLLLRGVEHADPPNPPGIPDATDSGQLYVRNTAGGAGPGGWGRVTAVAPFSMADAQHLTFDLPLGVGTLSDGRFRFTFESYYEGRLVDAVYDAWTEISSDPPAPPLCLVSSLDWQSTPFAAIENAFSTEFQAIPNDDVMSAYIAVSRGQATHGTDLPVLVGFDASGRITACNGDAFAADSFLPYSAGTAYHFRVDINVLSETYSVTVTPELSSSVMLARNFGFCEEQSGVGLLDNWALQASAGSNEVCGFTATACLADSDGDGVVNCSDFCPNDSTRWTAGPCGCGVVRIDLDGDGLADTASGDVDGNGTVDLYDYEVLLDCFAGPAANPAPRTTVSTTVCLLLFDSDGDGDVDGSDVRQWMPCLTGP